MGVVDDYILYIANMKEVVKPTMPNFDISAYTDSEYTSVVRELISDFENIDDLELTLQYLRSKLV